MAQQQEPVRGAGGRHRRVDDGALRIITGPDREELEVEISPVGSDGRRTCDVVRARHDGQRVVHAAVFPSVPVGVYVVWHDESTPSGTVVVRSGEVSEYRLT